MNKLTEYYLNNIKENIMSASSGWGLSWIMWEDENVGKPKKKTRKAIKVYISDLLQSIADGRERVKELHEKISSRDSEIDERKRLIRHWEEMYYNTTEGKAIREKDRENTIFEELIKNGQSPTDALIQRIYDKRFN